VTAEAPERDVPEVTACRERLMVTLTEAGEVAEVGGRDFSSLVADALQALSAEVGGAGFLTRSRPGSWEAALVVTSAVTVDHGWAVGL
jgi:hypothetical protein